MKKQWIKLIAFVLPVLILLVGTNYRIDPANLFHNIYEGVAESVMEGNPTYVFSGNVDGRQVRKEMIMRMPDHVDCIAVGPSLVMGISAEEMGGENSYNLGVAGACYYDVLALLGMMEAYGKKTDRVILCVDLVFFSPEVYNAENFHEPVMDYAEYMIAKLDGKDPKAPDTSRAKFWWNNLPQLFSVTYFQSAVELIQTRGIDQVLSDRYGVVGDENFEDVYYMPDGSWVYAAELRYNSPEYVEALGIDYTLEYIHPTGAHLPEENAEMFRKLILYLQDQGTEVELFLCPFSPALWDRILPEEYPMIWEVEALARDCAEEYDLKITGSYDPYELGITSADYYDARHVRRESQPLYFDFKE